MRTVALLKPHALRVGSRESSVQIPALLVPGVRLFADLLDDHLRDLLVVHQIVERLFEVLEILLLAQLAEKTEPVLSVCFLP
ncbi:MAG: hypothetical protein JWM20_405 [Patescibacteria group bacterium]|nr:hypothetical protein [Patescibacteria group bacterium]